VFEVTDVRGYKAICSDEIGYGKICAKRSWMNDEEWLNRTKRAITNPDIGIFTDADYSDREVYYLFVKGVRIRYLKVVVRFNERRVGHVVTATPANSGKPGERQIWSAQSN